MFKRKLSEETKKKISHALKGRMPKYIPNTKGSKRGAPWNKGLTKETDERVMKYSGDQNRGFKQGNIPRNTGLPKDDPRIVARSEKRRLKIISKEELERLYSREKKSTHVIAKMFNTNKTNILKRLRLWSIPVRNISDAAKNRPEVESTLTKVPCTSCGKEIRRTSYQLKHIKQPFCSKKCYYPTRFKGGRYFNKNGYVFVRHNGRIIPEHRLIWALHNQMHFIPKGCEIHHINNIHNDNRPENLVLLPIETHRGVHVEMRKRLKEGENHSF